MDINTKIEQLSESDRIRFKDTVEDIKYGRVFGQRHGPEYTEAEMTKLKEDAFSRLFISIDTKIEQLSEVARERFQQNLAAVLEDDTWLSFRGLDASNYDENMLRVILYREMFENDFSYFTQR